MNLTPSRQIARYVAQCQYEDDDPDRNVDQERGSPRPIGDEQTTEYRSDHCPDRKDAAEQTNRAIARIPEMIDDDPRC